MRISSIGYPNRVSYTGNTVVNNTRTVVEPKQNEKVKKAVKYAAIGAVALAVVGLVVGKGKSLGKLFNGFGKNNGKQAGENVEEIVPEVLDYDYFGQRIVERKAKKNIPPKNIVIDEAGNILDQRRKTTSMSDFFDSIDKQRKKSKVESGVDLVADILDGLAWFV